MLTLFALAIGIYLSRKANLHCEDGITSMTVDYQAILKDLGALFALINIFYQQTTSVGHSTRQYFDTSCNLVVPTGFECSVTTTRLATALDRLIPQPSKSKGIRLA